ncbi:MULTISPECIES: heparan-alpha-glucosaminide N-acetyltransferase domain-containing protein [unclassified Spirosoma]|uniref:DUF1624 domain-containing protein n=1 Tax=unclassified Spirosoma TaxID=2621999 RepID=UPI00096442DE|nr:MULTISPECIES: heparan-alpha-glucosaminide N-acetyltransferase domain-containing protein [unclassified Spirosoma]MBN8820932.1 DUF1624 domain-containing protein [Spirosoma sp.]OJW75943.1 MAG: hypothetical protein BGO59_03680 [Spirosoma sp. 48-14]
MKRVAAIDVTRGLVMVIMALDHVRDLLHTPALTQNPTDLTTTTPAIFLTRWITHLCAPTFVFLSGTSAYLSLRRQADSSRNDALRFLRSRGLVLLLLELTIINFAFWFDLHFQSLMLQVIYAIGFGLVILSFLAKLPVRTVGIIGLVIVLGHNILQLVPSFTNPAARLIWALLFRTDFFPVSPTFALLVAYPVIPWLGIMLVGFACGQLLERPIENRKLLLLRIGLGALALFILLRFLNIYGDPAPWSSQKSPLFTFFSFINVTKYPPSLLYDLVTLGLMFVFLAIIDGANNAFTRWMSVYGKVPMFYYILHWYLVHLSLIGMALGLGYSLADLPSGPMNFGRPANAGISLEYVYLVWISIVLFLYPLCRWYGRYKSEHSSIKWLRYI